MDAADAVLIGLLAIDLIVGASLATVVGFEYRRQRRLAREAGEFVPAPATGQFVFLGIVWASSFLILYVVASVVLARLAAP